MLAYSRYFDEMLQERFLQNAVREGEIDVIEIYDPMAAFTSALRSSELDESADSLTLSNVSQ